MIGKLKALFGLAARDDVGTDELAPSLPQAEDELTAAREAQAEAQRVYRASLRDGDLTKSNKLDTARREALVRVEAAEELVSTLRERLVEAEAREEEARRVERYQAAKQQAHEAAEVLRTMYAPACADVLAILLAVTQAEVAVSRANADLPRNAEPLSAVEHGVRSIPGKPEEILSEDTVTIWCRPGDLRHDRINQDRVRFDANGRGYVQPPLGQCEYLVARQFTVTRLIPMQTPNVPDLLATKLCLPGLNALDPSFFEPFDRRFDDVSLGNTLKKLYDGARDRPARARKSAEEKTRYTLVGSYDLEAEMKQPASLLDTLRRRA